MAAQVTKKQILNAYDNEKSFEVIRKLERKAYAEENRVRRREEKTLAEIDAQGRRVMELARELNYRDTDYGSRNMPRGVRDRFYNRAVPAYNSVRSRAMGLSNG